MKPPFISKGHDFTCRLCGPGGMFWAGVGGMHRVLPAHLLGTTTGQQEEWSERAELEVRLLVVKRCGFATA